jgi:hypothetical protein
LVLMSLKSVPSKHAVSRNSLVVHVTMGSLENWRVLYMVTTTIRLLNFLDGIDR